MPLSCGNPPFFVAQCGVRQLFPETEDTRGNKIGTEADRKRTPAAKTTANFTPHRDGGGQKGSQERGTSTRSKKNPGKRPHKGG